MAKISASVYAADLSHLQASVKEAQRDGAGGFHVDVIDNHFTSGFGFPVPFVKYLRECTKKPLDIHLQIEHPERCLASFAEAGADSIVFHIEAAHGQEASLLRSIRKNGARGGVALCPDTELDCLKNCLSLCDSVLLLGVHPGQTGEDFLPDTIERIRKLRNMVESQGLETEILVDGQIQRKSGAACLQAGADTLVIGKAFFQNEDRIELVRALQNVV